MPASSRRRDAAASTGDSAGISAATAAARHTGAMTAATFAIDAGRPGVQRLEVWNRRLARR
jgi:hypothetical protein